MPAWWPRKSRKSKSEDFLPASPHSNPLSPSVKTVAPKAAVGRDILNHHHHHHHHHQHQHQLQVAIGSGGFSGFDSDGREGIGLPLPRPSISSTYSLGIENGSSSVSSVSSSGSGDDHHQSDSARKQIDIKFNARSKSPGPTSRGPASPTSPHTRFAGMSFEAPTGRQEELRSESHPLPLPPSSPTSPSALSSHMNMKSPMVETHAICASSKWKKGKLLGKGTFGNVYIGFNSETGNMCAIKEVRVASDDRSFKECLKQLHQEINLLSQLSHPNIVRYYGSEFDEDTLSVFLEYVSGGSIHKLLQEYGAFKEPVIQNYTRQIVHGLAYLHGLASTHGKSVVHRDIKGANILVDPNGDIKLADFGMAKHIANCTTVLSFKGSPYWMAPEVIMNNGYGYNTAVDIWSLGCTILEMATSKPPWSQYEGVAAIFKIGNSKDVPNIPEHLSTEAKSFIRLCLQREPSARPTALQLLDHPFIREQTTSKVSNGNTNIGITKDPYTSSPFDGSRTPPSLDLYPERTNMSRMDPAGYAVKPSGTSSRALWSPRDIPVRVVASSMPVSPSSSPLRQFGGPSHSRSCLPSPPHPYSPAGQGQSSYTVTDYSFQLPMSPNNTRYNFDPWQQDTATSFFRSQTPPGGSPRTRII